MKKTLAIFLVLSTLFVLFACNGNTQDDSTKATGDSLHEKNVVIANGEGSEYTIVWKAGAKGSEKQAVMDLSNKITAATGAVLEMKVDLVVLGEDATIPEKALFVGKVGYDDVKAKWSDLGENDYAVTEENGNVYILGGSETAIYYAMLHFRNSFVNSETKSVVVPTGYSYVFEGADSREDYINDPNKLLMNWITEFETPAEMLDFEEKRASFANPAGRMMSFAHRGDSEHYPENSIEGVISSVMMGSDCIEIDVRVTKDGVPVLFHDDNLGGKTNYDSVKGKEVNGIRLPMSSRISDWTFEQLRCLRLKNGHGGSEELTNYVIPTLEEVLKVCNNRCMVMIDKIGSASDMRNIVFPVCEKLDAYSCIIFCGGMSMADAYQLRKQLRDKGVAEDELPTYLGRVLWSSKGTWESSINQLKQGGMPPLLRISGFGSSTSDDCLWYLEQMKEGLLSVKGKVRWQFDSQLGGNGINETVAVWDKAYELGVNSMMVDKPLAICQYIAQKHFS